MTQYREEDAVSTRAPSAHSPHRRTAGPCSPLYWRSPIRGPWLTSFLGTLLIPGFVMMAVTGFIDHWAHYPEFAGNGTVGPGGDIPVLFHFPSSWPSWSYAATQGTHSTLGLALTPLVLAKLWSVMPKLFRRPVIASVASAIERVSVLMLVASVLVEFATGIVSIDNYYRYSFAFNTVHYYGAWVVVTLVVLHACLKVPVIRRAYRERGVLKPLLDGVGQTKAEAPDSGGLVAVDPAAPTISRRGLLAMVGGASLTIFAVQVGSTIGGPFRSLALLAPRGRVFGTGPNDFPVTGTATAAQITSAMTDSNWRLTVIGARTISLSRQQLFAMPQSTRTLSITCTDGWSTTQHWTGVALAGLGRLVDAPDDAILHAVSLEAPTGRFPQARFSHAQYSDPSALLALQVNGVDLSIDHGYPARVIVPNVPGEHNTKWVRELSFEAA
jgi:DMSO/TMAO reductase YedYZ molybdopterin-dependent catalytic subunit